MDATEIDALDESPQGQQLRWKLELDAAKREVEAWHKQGEELLKRFRAERKKQDRDVRLNLFSSNVQTQAALLYGQTPRVDVSRRFGDARDDVARVAAEALERLLNTEIEADADSYKLALAYALTDRLLPGLGMVRVRYVAEFEETEAQEALTDDEGNELAPEVPAVEEKADEHVEVEYVHWRDHLWSPARTFHEVRWWAFRAEMSREELVERFGDLGKLVPLNAKRARGTETSDAVQLTPWSRAEVWEIWDADEKCVHWYVDGFSQLLDSKPDPLGLDGFWPFPRPMVANLTTSNMVPVPDYVLAQDLYIEIDDRATRIALLEKALRVAGVYDKNSEEVKRLLSETSSHRNELIPVSNWAAFNEKGAIAGSIAWLPIEQVVGVMDKLREMQRDAMERLYQVTGMSDIMRGQATGPGTTATEQSIKARFGSVRMQAMQDDFARFASDVQRLKAEIISKHFEPSTIIERSNLMLTPDAQLAPQAAELIKSRLGMWRVEVKPESVSMADMAAQRNEATEYVMGLSQFLTAATPLVQSMPGAMPLVLELMGAVMSRFKAGDQLEGIIDRAVAAAQQQAQQPQQAQPPDPKLQAAQLKAQTDLQKVVMEHQADMERLQQEAAVEAAKQQSQAVWNVREEAAKSRIQTLRALRTPGGVAP